MLGLSPYKRFNGVQGAEAISTSAAVVAPSAKKGSDAGDMLVVLHKPLDALAITATMEGSEQQRRRINLIYALVAPIAAWLVYLGFTGAGDAGLKVAGIAMAFCAGAFVCVALADLMPEVQFHSHHRFLLTGALGLGVGVAVLLGYVEGHNHGMHDHGGSETGHEGHDHSGPDLTGQDHTGHDHAGHDHD